MKAGIKYIIFLWIFNIHWSLMWWHVLCLLWTRIETTFHLYYILIELEVILCPYFIIYVVPRNHVTILVSFAFSHIVTIVWKAAGVKHIMSCSFIRLKRVFQEMFFYLTCEKHVMNQLMIFSFKQEPCFIFVSMAATETLTLFCCRSVVILNLFPILIAYSEFTETSLDCPTSHSPFVVTRVS